MKIFLDLDGCFADFDSFMDREFGKDRNRHDNSFWTVLSKYDRVFYHLDVLTDSLKIITMLQHHDLEFLTAIPEPTGNLITAREDKIAWIHKHISRYIKVNTVVGGKNKYKWLEQHPGALLIDDYERNTIAWENAGGVAILHTSVEDTIKKLKELNLA